MNMLLSKQLVVKLQKEIKEHPFKENEIRRIEGMGNMFMASANSAVGQEYDILFSLYFDEVKYIFLRNKK